MQKDFPKKRYAIFDNDVPAKYKYAVAKIPKLFKTRAQAKLYIKRRNLKNVKILTY